MADEQGTDIDPRLQEFGEDFNNRVPDSALWNDSDVLRTYPDGWSVTVLVGGRFISGRVANIESWVQAMQMHASVGIDHPVSIGVELARRGLMEARETREKVEEMIDAAGDEGVELTVEQRIDLNAYSGFLHLIDARTLYDGAFVPPDGVPMRIRYAEVQAWTHGSLGISPS